METPDGKVGIAECMRSFEPYLAVNRRTEKPVIHLSLNPHPDDELSDEQMEAIGKKFLSSLIITDLSQVKRGTSSAMTTTRVPTSTSSPCVLMNREEN